MRDWALQAAALLLLVACLAFASWQLEQNFEDIGVDFSFEFLDEPAGYDIKAGLIGFDRSDIHARVALVGFLNTMLLAAVAILLSSLIGWVLGALRIAGWGPVRGCVGGIVELLRRVPVLLQILLWHTAMVGLPSPRKAYEPVSGLFMSNRGLTLPRLEADAEFWAALLASLVIVVAVVWWRYRSKRRGEGQETVLSTAIYAALVVGLPVLTFAAMRPSVALDWPTLSSFDFTGGTTVQPAFLAILLALSIHGGACIAETVRQWTGIEAGGRHQGSVLPSGIWPGLLGQYLEVVKNASLGIAVGYSGLVATLGGTSMNVTGRAIECMSIVWLLYLCLTLPIAALQRRLERRAVRGARVCKDELASSQEQDDLPNTIEAGRRFMRMRGQAAVFLIILVLGLAAAVPALDWLIFDSVLNASSRRDCDAIGQGACWAAVAANIDGFIYGVYPEAERWRVDLAVTLFLLALVVPLIWPKRIGTTAILAGLVSLAFASVLLFGLFGLEPISTNKFGGFLLVLIVIIGGSLGALPLGVALAFGRRSRLPVIRALSVAFVELVRSTPVIVMLFFAATVLSYVLPSGFYVDLVIRIMLLVALVAGASISDVLVSALDSAEWSGDHRGPNIKGASLPSVLCNSISGIAESFADVIRHLPVFAIAGVFGPLVFSMSISVSSKWVGTRAELNLAIAAGYVLLSLAISGYAKLLTWRLSQRRPAEAHLTGN